MNWIIIAEPYLETSNGIKYLHKLCHHLNNMGEKAYLGFIEQNSDFVNRRVFAKQDERLVNKNLNTPILPNHLINKNFFDESIVLYPDILVGNPLNAKKIVRFLGNRQSNWPHREHLSIEEGAFILSHSNIFHPNPNATLFDSHIDSFFYQEDSLLPSIPFEKRNLNLLYHGKGIYHGQCNTYKNTFYIDRKWLTDRHQLALLLKQTKFLFTYDSLSNINSEAIAAGAAPVFMRFDPWTEAEINSLEHAYMPRGTVSCLDDDNIYATIDEASFIKQRKNYLESIKTLQQTWDSRLLETVNKIKNYFK